MKDEKLTESAIIRGLTALLLRRGMPTEPVIAGTLGGIPIGAAIVEVLNDYVLATPMSPTLAATVGSLATIAFAYLFKGRVPKGGNA